jgi:asparagine synthase (glutamine-hydrolysing)
LSAEASDALGRRTASVLLPGPHQVRLAQSSRHRADEQDDAPARQGDVWCVADARLDDRPRLAALLGLTSSELAALSEAEILLRGYLRCGSRLPERLVGAFAFVVWDGREEVMVAARDHFGLRPLAFAVCSGALVLASDDATILDVGGPRSIDEEVLVARALRNFSVLLQRSPWSGIRRVPPGHRLIARPDGRHRVECYWRPTARPVVSRAAPAEHARHLRAVMETAVADAVRDPVPTGTHLSGGLDSTAVAVLAQRALRTRGSALAGAWSWSPRPEDVPFDDPSFGEEIDERHRVLEIAADLGVPLEFVTFDEAVAEAKERRLARLEPNERMLLHWAVLRAAAARDVRVLLSGWGGDEGPSFNGRGHVASLVARGRLLAAWRTAGALAARRGEPAGRLSAARNFYYMGVHRLLPLSLRLRREGVYRDEKMLRAQGLGLETMHPTARRQQGAAARRNRGREQSGRATQVGLLRSGHLTIRVEAWELGARPFGIDHRYPLLDLRVVELVLSLPESLNVHDGWQRWLAREATAGLLPDDVRWGWPKREPAMMQQLRHPLNHHSGEPPQAARISELQRRRLRVLRATSER